MNNISNCPICDSQKSHHFITCKDYTVSNEDFKIVECDSCNFRYTNPIPTEDKIGEYYKSEDYISHSGTKKGIVNWLYHKVRNHTLKKKYQLVSKHAKENSLLDIGCGTGDFLGYVNQKGWQVKGLEPDGDARALGEKNHGISIQSTEELHQLPNESYGAITMWHVLEHVYHLNKDVEKIKSLLKKDGTLFVAVPNCSSADAQKYGEYWAAYDVPIHLYHFRPQNIKDLFAKYNMEVTDILPMKFDSYYVSLLSEKYKRGNKGFSIGALFSGFFSGLSSNMKAKGNKYSSQIYVIKHIN